MAKILLLNSTDKMLLGAEVHDLCLHFQQNIYFESWFPSSEAAYLQGCEEITVVAVLVPRQSPLYPSKKMLAAKTHLQFVYHNGRELTQLHSTSVNRKRIPKAETIKEPLSA